MINRQPSRLRLRVIHRHQSGDGVCRRVSELVYIGGRPRAVLGWIGVGSLRAPVYLGELDPAKLRPTGESGTFEYAGLTVDPRFEHPLPG